MPISVEPSSDRDLADASESTTPPLQPVSEIQYESAASPITRRQFRLVFLLTIVNTIMLFLFVAGPGINKMVGGWWQDYKQWRADRAAAAQKAQTTAKTIADFHSALQFDSPENLAIYDEDPGRAARLLAADSNYARARSSRYVYLTPAPWQSPAIRISTAFPPPFNTARDATVFLHSRKSPSGIERAVHVEFFASQDMQQITARGNREYSLIEQKLLMAAAYECKTDGSLVKSDYRSIRVSPPAENPTRVIWKPGEQGRWETGEVQVQNRHIFRLFGGQPDPANPSHFTIDFELDGKRGVIDGWLLNDLTVALQPRLGRITDDDGLGLQRVWDPVAVSPATRPIAPPDLPPAHKN